MRLPILAVVASFLTAVAACGSSTTEGCVDGTCTGGSAGSGGTTGAPSVDACDKTPKTGDIPCDVFKVIHDKCHSCHVEPTMGGAPFPIVSYADTQEPYNAERLVFQQMWHQIQPGAAPRMPLNGALTDAELKTLSDWLAACAPPEPAGMGCSCPGKGCD